MKSNFFNYFQRKGLSPRDFLIKLFIILGIISFIIGLILILLEGREDIPEGVLGISIGVGASVILFIIIILLLEYFIKFKISLKNFARSIGMTNSGLKQDFRFLDNFENYKIYDYNFKNTKIGRFELYLLYSSNMELAVNSGIFNLTVFEIPLKNIISSQLFLKPGDKGEIVGKKDRRIFINVSNFKKIELESEQFNKKYIIYADKPEEAYYYFNPIVIDVLNNIDQEIGIVVTKDYFVLFNFNLILDPQKLKIMYQTFKIIANSHFKGDLDL